MGDGPLWALAAAFIGGLFTFLVQKLRGQTDETVAVMGQWQKLLDANNATRDREINVLKERLAVVEKELNEVRDQASKDMAALRKQHAEEREQMQKTHRAEMRQLRELNEGLQRMIAQNSKSTAQLMGDTPVTTPLKRSFPASDGEGGK